MAVHSGKVLVVDDEETVRNICVKFVQRLGFEVIGAADGEEALALFKKEVNEIVCVLLDLAMPGKSSVSTLRELKVIRPDILVILCGYSEQDAQRQFDGEGLAGFLQKSYRLEELKAKLGGILKGFG